MKCIWYVCSLNACTQLREFHARPFPEIIYSTAPARSAYAHTADCADAQGTKKKNDYTQMKVPDTLYTLLALCTVFM